MSMSKTRYRVNATQKQPMKISSGTSTMIERNNWLSRADNRTAAPSAEPARTAPNKTHRICCRATPVLRRNRTNSPMKLATVATMSPVSGPVMTSS